MSSDRTRQKWEEEDLEFARKYGATTAPPKISDFEGQKGDYSKWKRAQRSWKKQTEDEYNKSKKNDGKLTVDQYLKMQQMEQDKNSSQATLAQGNKKIDLDRNTLRQNRLKDMSKSEYEKNVRLATYADGDIGESFHPKDFQTLQKLSEERMASSGGGNDLLSRFQGENPERQAELMAKYKASQASKTNEFGDDLTKDAPTSSTTYKDGQRTWSYPGVTDLKTGEVRNAMSITSPYGSEEEYQNKGGVVGQNPDGSWKWDRNVKAGSGGGFFQRGGLSDMGRDMAGDAPRRVPQEKQWTRPLFDNFKYVQRTGQSNRSIASAGKTPTTIPPDGPTSAPTNYNALGGRTAEGMDTEKFVRDGLVQAKKVSDTGFAKYPTGSSTLDRSPQAPNRETTEFVNSLLSQANRDKIKKKYSGSLRDNVTGIFGKSTVGKMSDEDYLSTSNRLNSRLRNLGRQ